MEYSQIILSYFDILAYFPSILFRFSDVIPHGKARPFNVGCFLFFLCSLSQKLFLLKIGDYNYAHPLSHQKIFNSPSIRIYLIVFFSSIKRNIDPRPGSKHYKLIIEKIKPNKQREDCKVSGVLCSEK